MHQRTLSRLDAMQDLSSKQSAGQLQWNRSLANGIANAAAVLAETVTELTPETTPGSLSPVQEETPEIMAAGEMFSCSIASVLTLILYIKIALS